MEEEDKERNTFRKITSIEALDRRQEKKEILRRGYTENEWIDFNLFPLHHMYPEYIYD